MEFFRDQAAEQFERHTHSAWRPRKRIDGQPSHAHWSAMIDSRDFLAANTPGRKRGAARRLAPRSPSPAGSTSTIIALIWEKLDKVHAKHPDMVLLHGGSPKGAERIAARWADHRKVPQIALKPDWTKHAKAAPFKRNDRDARRPADWGHRLPRYWDSGKPCRQGAHDRYSHLVLWPRAARERRLLRGAQVDGTALDGEGPVRENGHRQLGAEKRLQALARVALAVAFW